MFSNSNNNSNVDGLMRRKKADLGNEPFHLVYEPNEWVREGV